jgi:hypothetical protein
LPKEAVATYVPTLILLFISLSIMTFTDPPESIISPHDEPTTSPEVDKAPPESAAPEPTVAADTTPTTKSPPVPAARANSPPPSNINMTTTQDPDAPSLPERPVPEPAPATDTEPPLDPQVASLQAIFPDFDVTILYAHIRV